MAFLLKMFWYRDFLVRIIGPKWPRCTVSASRAGQLQLAKNQAPRGGAMAGNAPGGQLRSGRTAQIGFTTADHAFRHGLGIRFRGRRAGTVFKIRSGYASASA